MNCKKKLKMLMPYIYIKSKKDAYQYTRESSVEPNIYNEYGDLKRTFYLKDTVCRHSPYTFSSINIGRTNTINWDRFNKALPIHFYSHDEMFGEVYNCKKKFGILLESEAIVPQLYHKCLEQKNTIKNFDAVFTHSEMLLKHYSNTFFIPGSSVWYGGTMGGGVLKDDIFKTKKKMISLVSSDKIQCELHRFRRTLAEWFYNNEKIDVMGTYRGGDYVSIADSLEEYRYSIVIENNITSCYFTEKLLNCFASMTIPIYVGAKDIDKFFNIDGIIRIYPDMRKEDIEKIIMNCTVERYESKLKAIQDNYERIKEYYSIEDYIYSHYNSMFVL